MISAVLDTNVLVSGLVGVEKPTSTPGEVIRRWRAKSFELIVSEHILSELAETRTDPYFTRRLSSAAIAEAFDVLRMDAIIQPITVPVSGVASHPEDDAVIATALSARCSYLVTGDKQLKGRGTYHGTSLISPRQFLNVLEGNSLP